jgi:hydrogenase nickel incorporation protein HypA/HybF
LILHELSVTQSVLDIALAHAQRAGASRIVRVHLAVGALSGIVDESVQFYFDFVSRDTLAEGAKLVFRKVPAQFRCQSCGAEYEPDGSDWTCPLCGELRPKAVGGRELLVESIEVE